MQPWLAWTLYTRQYSCLCLQNARAVRMCYCTLLGLRPQLLFKCFVEQVLPVTPNKGPVMCHEVQTLSFVN